MGTCQLENNKMVVQTTKNKVLTVDNNYNICWSNWVFIENNLEQEIEYKLWGVRVKNADFSDWTYGLVNAMTLESVKLKVNSNYISSIEEEENWIFLVILDNEDEINITKKNITL